MFVRSTLLVPSALALCAPLAAQVVSGPITRIPTTCPSRSAIECASNQARVAAATCAHRSAGPRSDEICCV